MNDEQLLRYSRHVLLDEIGIEGQQRLLAAHALVIGAGGLGCPAALYLAAAGVGRITVVDDDVVDLTNLQRQVAHDASRLGQPKAVSLAATLARLNPGVQVQPWVRRADAALLDMLVPAADVVLDCCDNFRTRHAVNAACVRHGRPLVSGAAVGFDAQVAVYDTRPGVHHSDGSDGSDARTPGPCYGCLFPPEAEAQDVACATLGVFAPLVGIVGSVQAAEALKLLLPTGTPLRGALLMLDARHMAWDRIAVARRADCSVCSTGAAPGAAPGAPAEGH